MQHHFFTPVPDLRLVRDDLPPALLELIQRALAKDPDDRFPATRDMMAAIESIPFSEDDRRTSEQALQILARGEPISRIISRPVPRLSDAMTQPLRLPRRVRWARPRNLAGAAAVVAVLAIWGTTRNDAAARANPAPQQAQAVVPVAVPAAPTRSAEPGRLRLLTSPPDAVILIDGKTVGVGVVFDLSVPAGVRRLEIRAPGYATLDSSVEVRSGATVSLGRIALRSQDRRP